MCNEYRIEEEYNDKIIQKTTKIIINYSTLR